MKPGRPKNKKDDKAKLMEAGEGGRGEGGGEMDGGREGGERDEGRE